MTERRRVPAAFQRLLDALTEEDKFRKFRIAHDRDPHSDDELEEFIHKIARELYNNDYDEWPDDDEEVV